MDSKAKINTSGATGGTSRSTSMSLKQSDSFRKSQFESDMVKGSFSFQKLSSETHNSKAKVILKSVELDTNASQACSIKILLFSYTPL